MMALSNHPLLAANAVSSLPPSLPLPQKLERTVQAGNRVAKMEALEVARMDAFREAVSGGNIPLA